MRLKVAGFPSGTPPWLSVGFAPSANRMIGTFAVICTPGAETAVQLYYLGGYETSSTTPLAEAAQVLEDTSFYVQGTSMSLTFSVPLSASWLDLAGDKTHLLFAMGDSAELGYHGFDNRMAKTMALTHWEPPPPPLPPPPPSAPPAPPPGAPDEIRVFVVTIVCTINLPHFVGDGQEEFRTLLASLLGVRPADVVLTIVALAGRRLQASDTIQVTVAVHTATEEEAAAVATAAGLHLADPQTASSSLEVPFLTVGAPETTVGFVTRPPPHLPASPSLPPSPPPPDVPPSVSAPLADASSLSTAELDGGVMAGIVAAALVVVVCAAALLYVLKRRCSEDDIPPPPPFEDGDLPALAEMKQKRGTMFVSIGELSSTSDNGSGELEHTFSMKIGSKDRPSAPSAPMVDATI